MSLTNTISHRLFVSAVAQEPPPTEPDDMLDGAVFAPGEATAVPLQLVPDEIDIDDVWNSAASDARHPILD